MGRRSWWFRINIIMAEFKINSITDRSGYCGPVISGVSTNNSTGCMIIPAGPTEFRGGRGRGIVCGGRDNPSPGLAEITIDMHEIATTGDAIDFGDLVDGNTGAKGNCGSATRAILAGGYDPSPGALVTTIQYVVMSSQGGAIDWGDIAIAKNGISAGSNGIRGVFQGGATPDYTSEMSSLDLQSLGNATNFGSHLEGAIRNAGCVQNGTRGLWGGGQGPTSNYFTIVSYEFATTGSGTKFGELLENPSNMAPVSSGIRGVLAGGATPDSAPLAINTIQYITISTEGNATDFGDLTAARRNISGNTNRIRGTIAGGTTASSGSGNNVNTIDFITIASTGNAQDFGDLTVVRRSADSGGSDTHGGLVR